MVVFFFNFIFMFTLTFQNKRTILNTDLNESYKACLVCLDLLDDALRDRDGSVTATPVQVAELWEIANDCLEHKDLLQNPSLGMKVKNKIRLEIYHSLRRKLKRSGLL